MFKKLKNWFNEKATQRKLRAIARELADELLIGELVQTAEHSGLPGADKRKWVLDSISKKLKEIL